jgi:hypothetical protein
VRGGRVYAGVLVARKLLVSAVAFASVGVAAWFAAVVLRSDMSTNPLPHIVPPPCRDRPPAGLLAWPAGRAAGVDGV